MARDVNGTYTRVSNTFTAPIAGTPISPTDADAFWDELDTEITDSLSRSGKGGMSADLDMNNNDITEIKTAVFQGSTSGNTTVKATAIAGTTELTLPAATATLATTSDKLSAFAATTSLELKGVISDETGSGALVFATTPTLVTPVLGVATATSINKVAFTAPATSATLALVDGTTVTGPASTGTLMTLGNTETVTGAKTFSAAVTLSADVTMTQTTHTYKMDTSDGTDNKRLAFTGGGATGTDRGGHVFCHGNEFSSNAGSVIINNGSGGTVLFAAIGTTASAANAFLDSGNSNSLLRSTSSLRYKRDVEPVNESAADAILNLKPIWYRSKAKADNPDWSWYGFGAEDVAEIDPRLVSWGYAPEDLVPDQVDGEAVGTFSPKPGASMIPDGVAYERLSVLLLMLIKKMDARLSALEGKKGKNAD